MHFWILASLASAFFLGLYQLCTKHAVNENAVLPVLFLSNVCSACVWLCLMAWDAAAGGAPAMLQVAGLSGRGHLLLLLKSIIVRNKRTNHQAIVVPASADQNELVHTEVDPLSKGSERLSA